MMSKFRSGQLVRLNRNMSNNSAASGEYKIVRPLPENNGQLQYRIKSVREAHERVVNEGDLEKG